jgi:hypothetical protein
VWMQNYMKNRIKSDFQIDDYTQSYPNPQKSR